MRPKQDLEQIFLRQEQAVVYLFSRYWERIAAFKGKDKRIGRIHTHFPDFAFVDMDGEEEGIEFEYDLCSFRSHLEGGCLKKLHQKGVRRLYLVFWEYNDDKNDLRAKIAKKAKFDVVFVCLKDWFQAEVMRAAGTEGLQTFWRFTTKGKGFNLRKVYSLSDIVDATEKLNREHAIETFPVDRSLYRAIGFNAEGADFIDCDHLEKIRLFTTSARFAETRIPSRLFMKSSGCEYFNGYFDIKIAFKVVTASRSVMKFVADFYFEKWAQNITEEKCFVGGFKRLEYEKGKHLYDFLIGRDYRLDTQGAKIIKKKEHMDEIDRIIAGRLSQGPQRGAKR
jgi:hypothetical protein